MGPVHNASRVRSAATAPATTVGSVGCAVASAVMANRNGTVTGPKPVCTHTRKRPCIPALAGAATATAAVVAKAKGGNQPTASAAGNASGSMDASKATYMCVHPRASRVAASSGHTPGGPS